MKTEDKEEVVARSAVAGWYVAITGLGLWQVFRGKRKNAPAHPVVGKLAAAVEDAFARAEHQASESHKESPYVLAVLPPDTERGDRTPTQPQLQDLQAEEGSEAMDRLARIAEEEFREDRKRELQHEPLVEQEHPVPPFQQPGHPWSHNSEIVARVLRYQNLEEPRLQGWSEPRPAKLPMPTYTPAIMAFGIVLFAMGLATTWYVCVAGALVFAVAARRWVQELQEE